MSRYASAEIRFNLLALIKNREDVYKTRIGEIEERISNINNSTELMQLNEEREQLSLKIEMEKDKFKRYEVTQFFSLEECSIAIFILLFKNCFSFFLTFSAKIPYASITSFNLYIILFEFWQNAVNYKHALNTLEKRCQKELKTARKRKEKLLAVKNNIILIINI
jgi:hypothetical protein